MAKPLTAEAFARLMAPFEPFEARPHIAVGVSGGGDSMALTLLADAWARARGGRVTALGVDHGLRPGSADETATVAGWLAARGIGYVRLAWTDPKPDAGIQDAARQARYRLLDDWCRANGVLHLLVAHNQEDQAETLLLRLGRGSGPDGLAAMSTVRELGACRLLRPLLTVRRATLRDFLEDLGQPWLDDPSNADPRFARPRLRRRMAASAAAGDDAFADVRALAESARRYGLARVVLERETDRLLAGACRFDAAGFATFGMDALLTAPEDLAVRAFGRVLAAVGGLGYPPRRSRIERLIGEIRGAAAGHVPAMTLGRCQIVAARFASGDDSGADGGAEGASLMISSLAISSLAIFRERRNAPEPLRHVPDARLVWDRRFFVQFGARPRTAGPGLRLRALAPADWHHIVEHTPEVRDRRCLPGAALWGLPALADDHGVFAIPHLQYLRDPDGGSGIAAIGFRPAQAASTAGFRVA